MYMFLFIMVSEVLQGDVVNYFGHFLNLEFSYNLDKEEKCFSSYVIIQLVKSFVI